MAPTAERMEVWGCKRMDPMQEMMATTLMARGLRGLQIETLMLWTVLRDHFTLATIH
jgi:hypothetical protein